MGSLDGKIAIVTGGNRGIGKAIARGLAREGASVVIAARDAELLRRTADELSTDGATVVAHPADVTDEAAVEQLFAATLARFGRLDLLVCNAGGFGSAPLEAFSTADWNRIIGVNLTGPFLCSRAAMRIMKPQGGGRIIIVASISAHRVRPNNVAYNASKHGVWGLAQSIALEGREYGISCSCLNPGNTEVERMRTRPSVNQGEPMMHVDDLARVAVLMAQMPPDVSILEATVIPNRQLYVGRG